MVLLRPRFMKIVPTVFLFIFIVFTGFCRAEGPLTESTPDNSKATLSRDYGHLPLYFVENRGQMPKSVKFHAAGRRHIVGFKEDGIHFSFSEPEQNAGDGEGTPSGQNPGIQRRVVDMIPVGIRPEVRVSGMDEREHKVNYFFGNDPKNWLTDIPTYKAVVYHDAYPGIDLKFYADAHQMEYDVIVQPGADPDQVKFQYSGIESLALSEQGDLLIKIPGGDVLVQKKPVIYQEVSGTRIAREGSFKLHESTATAEHAYGFEIAGYDRKLPLVIDPILVYSTYLGGSEQDNANAIAVDSAGCAYVVGSTKSVSASYDPFPTRTPLVTPYNLATTSASVDTAAFVTKLNTDGNDLVYSTFIAGIDIDVVGLGNNVTQGLAIAVDTAGRAVVAGLTYSDHFPIWPQNTAVQIYQNTCNSSSCNHTGFVTKLSAAGSALVFSTYLGGKSRDQISCVALDPSNNIYVGGFTVWFNESFGDFTGGPTIIGTPGPGYSGFVTKLSSADYPAKLYSTIVGGTSGVTSIAVNGSQMPIFAGATPTNTLPVVGPLPGQSVNHVTTGQETGFIAQMNTGGWGLTFASYLGGDDWTRVESVALDSAGMVYATGYTLSSTASFPITPNAYQTTRPAGNYISTFACKIVSGSQFGYSTFLAGNGSEPPYVGTGYNFKNTIAVDSAGNAYVAGTTSSTNFPPNPGYERGSSLNNGFLVKLNPTGTGLLYSTYFGGSDTTNIYGLALDSLANAYVTGFTTATDLPLGNQTYMGGGGDAFIAKFKSSGSLVATINAEAANAGAKWKVNGGAWKSSGAIVSNLSAGQYTVQFSDITGWSTPEPQTINLGTSGQVSVSGVYNRKSDLPSILMLLLSD